MRPTILLWDIDGTLITTGGAGRKAIERAFGELFGRPDAFSGFDFSGMTDRAIVRGGFAAIGRASVDDAEIEAVLDSYVGVLKKEVAAATVYRLHDGIERALDAAREREGVAVGLGTGNIEAGAKVKLDRVGIYDRFAFGGFGSDHENRVELIRRGAERGAARLGVPLSGCRVVVIGDTPKDVAAAQGIGAQSLAVCTGNIKADALIASGATWTFPNLDAPGAHEALFG